LFLPALYVAWYKIREPSDEDRQKAAREKEHEGAQSHS
jgi:hypothetical protein